MMTKQDALDGMQKAKDERVLRNKQNQKQYKNNGAKAPFKTEQNEKASNHIFQPMVN